MRLLPEEEAASLLASHNMPFAVGLRLTRIISDLPAECLPDAMRVPIPISYPPARPPAPRLLSPEVHHRS